MTNIYVTDNNGILYVHMDVQVNLCSHKKVYRICSYLIYDYFIGIINVSQNTENIIIISTFVFVLLSLYLSLFHIIHHLVNSIIYSKQSCVRVKYYPYVDNVCILL